jgi:hypothetical protein
MYWMMCLDTGKSREPIFQVPFRRNPDFVGRIQCLAQLAAQLKPAKEKMQPRVSLQGLGGAGYKTWTPLDLTHSEFVPGKPKLPRSFAIVNTQSGQARTHFGYLDPLSALSQWDIARS